MRICRLSVPAASFVAVPDRYRGLLDEVAQVNRGSSAVPQSGSGLLAGLEQIGMAIARRARMPPTSRQCLECWQPPSCVLSAILARFG
jgi:hypothetical protein